MVKKEKKQLKKLHNDLIEKSGPETGEPSQEDEEFLEMIVEKIEEAAEKEEKVVKISLKEGFNLKIETPDVISLKTPQGNLYKSFSNVKLRKIETSDGEAKLHLTSLDRNES